MLFCSADRNALKGKDEEKAFEHPFDFINKYHELSNGQNKMLSLITEKN